MCHNHTSPSTHTHMCSLQCGTFVTIDEPALTHYHHLKSIKVYFSVLHSMGLDKLIMTCIHLYSIIQSFTTLNILCAPSIHFSLHPTPDKSRSFYCLHGFAFHLFLTSIPVSLMFSKVWKQDINSYNLDYFLLLGWGAINKDLATPFVWQVFQPVKC